MDKLRAIQYFNRAAATGSFASAARSFDVTTPAITHLVEALERSLGATLLHRTTRGVSLTADGERYYEVSRALIADLDELEQQLGPRGAKPRGTLTVGMRSGLGQLYVMPRIVRFLARYPDIELVFKTVETLAEIDKQELDIALMTGWPPTRDFVVRPLAQTRIIVCASPEYWEREGKPDEPRALVNHRCLVTLGGGGALLDHWAFEKNGERQIVDVRSNLLTHNQSWMMEAACNGAGVMRTTDLSARRYLLSGLLVAVLTDWEGLEAPTHFALYRPIKRRSKLVRVFVDFLAEVFGELDRERAALGGTIPRVSRPETFGRAHGRQSTYIARRRNAHP